MYNVYIYILVEFDDGHEMDDAMDGIIPELLITSSLLIFAAINIEHCQLVLIMQSKSTVDDS